MEYMNMKTLFLTTLAIAASSIVAAQNGLTVIHSDEYQMLQGLNISDNGKWVTGKIAQGPAFIYDVQNNKVTAAEGESEARCIADDGTAVGYGEGFLPYIFKTDGTSTKLETTGSGGLAETITADGKIIAGSTNWDAQMYSTHACIWQNDKMTYLPEPTDKWLGWTMNGTSAKYISNDGSVIVGWIIDDQATFPVIVWRKNMDDSYSALPLCRQYFDGGDGTRPYWNFNATGLSRNGRYIALTVQKAGWTEPTLPARYDLETQTLEVCEQDGLDLGETKGYYTSMIADDGTIIGYWQDVYNSIRKGYIWKAREAKPKLLAEEFPAISQFAEYDEYFHVPTGITPDGKKITGFAAITGGYETYILDIDEYSSSTGIENTVNDSKEEKTVVARYTTDGKKIKSSAKGINILKMSDGNSIKMNVK